MVIWKHNASPLTSSIPSPHMHVYIILTQIPHFYGELVEVMLVLNDE